MRTADRQRLDQLAITTNLAPGEPSVNDRLALSMGQGFPTLAPGQQWVMSNNALYYFCRGLSDSFMLMQGQMAVLTASLTAQGQQFASLQPRLALNEANIASALLSATANAAGLVATEAHAQAALSKGAANELRIAALEKQQAADELVQAAFAARLSNNEGLIAAAQQKADAAQATATTARQEAATAQAKADTDATAAAAAQTTANNALATAQAAQTAQAAMLAKIRQLLVATPSATIQVTPPLLVPVVFATPYPDANYSIELGKAAGGLVGADMSYTNKTANGFSIQLKNLGVAALVVAASTVDVFTYRS